MTRAELEHVLRAAASITNLNDFVVIGSQSILAQFPQAPAELRRSTEVDLYPRDAPELADLIDGSIGELSPFHETFGYYAQGVGPRTAILPRGWEQRLVPVAGPATRGATGWCLEIHDAVIAKLVAGREKDLAFAGAAAAHGLLDHARLKSLLAETVLEPAVRTAVEGRITRAFGHPEA